MHRHHRDGVIMTGLPSILPSNATKLELTLEQLSARIGSLPLPHADLWNPSKCPAKYLPWLAWALSVDEWDPLWTEAQKRAVIRNSVPVHIRKGTRKAVELALAAIDVDATIIEWWEAEALAGAEPKTFEIWLDLMGLIREGRDISETLAQIRRSVDATKPIAAHYTAHARIRARAPVHCGIGIRASGRLTNKPGLPPTPIVTASMRSVVASRAWARFTTPILEAS